REALDLPAPEGPSTATTSPGPPPVSLSSPVLLSRPAEVFTRAMLPGARPGPAGRPAGTQLAGPGLALRPVRQKTAARPGSYRRTGHPPASSASSSGPASAGRTDSSATPTGSPGECS